MADTRGGAVEAPAASKPLPPAARRALAEAAERRQARERSTPDAKQSEHGAAMGPTPLDTGTGKSRVLLAIFDHSQALPAGFKFCC
jgi:hypothetical protein